MYGAPSVFSPDRVQSRIIPPARTKRVNQKLATGGTSTTTFAPTIPQLSPVDQGPKPQTMAPCTITESVTVPGNMYNVFWLAPENDITVTLPALANMIKGASLSWRSYGPAMVTIVTAAEDGGSVIATLMQDQTLFMATDFDSGGGQWRILLGPTGTVGGGDVNGPLLGSRAGAIVSFADTTGRNLADNNFTTLNTDGSITFLSHMPNSLTLAPLDTGVDAGTWYLRNGIVDNVVGAATSDTLSNKTIIDTTNTITANYLRLIDGTAINVAAATVPVAGQILTATSAATATWADIPVLTKSDINKEEILELIERSITVKLDSLTELVQPAKPIVDKAPDIFISSVPAARSANDSSNITLKFDAATSVELTYAKFNNVVYLSFDSITQKTIKGRLVLKSCETLPQHICPIKTVNFPVYISANEIHDLARLRITPDGFVEITGPNPERGSIRYTWDSINIHYIGSTV